MSSDICQFDDRYRIFLQDESRYSGYADSISFPQSELDIIAVIKKLSGEQPITVQGSRTGLVGGSVPLGGHILNLSKMDRVLGLSQRDDGWYYLRVQPGLTLEGLNRHLAARSFDTRGWDDRSLGTLERFRGEVRQFWPPGPTEKTATIGGIAATNSGGICSYHYGSARDYIQNVRVVTATGQVLSISRGEYFLKHGVCSLPGGRHVDLDNSVMKKDQYFDLVDICIGGEGALGVFSELTLKLEPTPAELWGLTFFFNSEADSCRFIDELSGLDKGCQGRGAVLAATEYFDNDTLAAISEYREVSRRLAVIPEFDPRFDCLVYVELHGNAQDPVEQLAGDLLGLAMKYNCDKDHLWALCGETEIERLRILRHAAPEAVNLRLDTIRKRVPEITKLANDCSFDGISFTELLTLYRQDISEAALSSAIFGHAGSKHLHVNLFPENLGQFEIGRELIRDWAARAEEHGGKAVTEHGVGKLKKEIAALPAARQRRKLRQRVKEALQDAQADNCS